MNVKYSTACMRPEPLILIHTEIYLDNYDFQNLKVVNKSQMFKRKKLLVQIIGEFF